MKKFFTLLCIAVIANFYNAQAQVNPPKLTAVAYSSFGTTHATLGTQYYLDSMQYVYTPARSYNAKKGWQADTTIGWYNGSTAWTGYHLQSRVIYTYDDSDNQKIYLNQTYNYTDTSWHNSSMDSMAYDAHNNMIYWDYKTWDATTGNWQNQQRYIYIYSPTDKMLNMAGQTWDNTMGNWVNYYKFVAAYSSSDDLLLDSSMQWNNTTSTWGAGTSTFEHFVYASPHHVLRDTLYSWSVSNNTWLPNFAIDSIAYNTSGKQVYSRDRNFDTLSMTWASTDVYKTVYDASGYEVSDTAWTMGIPNILRTYINDAVGNVLVYTTSFWNNTASSWQDSFQYSHTYDSHGKIISNEFKQLVHGKGLVSQYKYFITYNSYGETLSSNGYIWDTTSAAWLHSTLDQYYYDSLLAVATIRQPMQAELSVYPVPAATTLTIDIKWAQPHAARLAIYDVSGRIYRQWETNASATYHSSIPVADLPVGNYILVAKTGDAITTARFSISR